MIAPKSVETQLTELEIFENLYTSYVKGEDLYLDPEEQYDDEDR